MEEISEQYDVGEEVVVLSSVYSHDPKFVGKVIGFSTEIVELETGRFFKKKHLIPRRLVQRFIRGKLPK